MFSYSHWTDCSSNICCLLWWRQKVTFPYISKMKHIYLKVELSRVVMNFYGILNNFPICSLCLRLRQTSVQWNLIIRHLLVVLLPLGSHDIPPDPALTLWHHWNVGDGDWQHLLPDLKASETSRGPPHLCSHWQLSGETLTDETTPPSYPLGSAAWLASGLAKWHFIRALMI